MTLKQMDTRPTNSELEILGVLWERGPCLVKDVHEEMEKRRRTGYTTVLKLMQIMAEKGLVTRDEANRAHVYSANISREHAQSGLMNDLVDKAFGGSAHKLALHVLGSAKATPEELDEIRSLIDRLGEKS